MKKVILAVMLLSSAQSDAMLSNVARTSVSSNMSLSRLFANAVQNETKQPIVIKLGKRTQNKLNETFEILRRPVVPNLNREYGFYNDLSGTIGSLQKTFVGMLIFLAVFPED